MEQFVCDLVDQIQEKVQSNVCVHAENVTKNNGVILHGIFLKRDDAAIAPIYYAEEFYEKYENEEMSISEIADKIICLFEENGRMMDTFEYENLFDVDHVKERIIFKVVNTEFNEFQLQTVPHIDFFNLSIVFCIFVDANEDYLSTATFTNSLMDFWGLTVNDLFALAKNNIKRLLPAKITTMAKALTLEDTLSNLLGFDRCPFFVLSNMVRIGGAATFLYEDVVKDFADCTNSDSVYILPSSINEVLLVPSCLNVEPEHLLSTVREVNSSTDLVPHEHFLSNEIYVYDRATDEIRMYETEVAV